MRGTNIQSKASVLPAEKPQLTTTKKMKTNIKLTEMQLERARGLTSARMWTGQPIPYAILKDPARKWGFIRAAIGRPNRGNTLTHAERMQEFQEICDAAMLVPEGKIRAKQKWYKAAGRDMKHATQDIMVSEWKGTFCRPRKVDSYELLKEASVLTKDNEVENISYNRRRALGLRPGYTNYLRKEIFSVEIEFVCTIGSALDTPSFRYPNTSNVQFVSDGSVSASEGQACPTEKEARISLEWGNVKRLYETCKMLREAGAVVNRSCGLHIHLDSRHLSAAQERTRRLRLISALPWLLEMVPASRRTNRYCWPNHIPHPPMSDARYRAINPRAYGRHRTTEIRLGSGTIDADKIMNWATILKYIANTRKRLKTFESFLKSEAPQHVKIWAVLRRDKFFPADGMVAECGETETT